MQNVWNAIASYLAKFDESVFKIQIRVRYAGICFTLRYGKERNKTSEITKPTRSFSKHLTKGKGASFCFFGQWNKVAGSGRVF